MRFLPLLLSLASCAPAPTSEPVHRWPYLLEDGVNVPENALMEGDRWAKRDRAEMLADTL